MLDIQTETARLATIIYKGRMQHLGLSAIAAGFTRAHFEPGS